MPISMIHTQHNSSFPHYAPSLAPPPAMPYTANLHQQPAKNSPSFLSSGSVGGYVSTTPSKEDTTHRYHLLLSSHDHTTENYPNGTKSQYDNHGTAPLKHTINSDLDMPTLNGNYHQQCTHPLYNPNSNNNTITGSHPHHSSTTMNHSPPHTNEHTSNYPTMTSLTSSNPFLINSPSLPPPHYQLATENAISSYPPSSHPPATSAQTSQSTIDVSSMDRRPWSSHTHPRGWSNQVPLSSTPPSPPKSSSPSQSSSAPPPTLEATRNPSPTQTRSAPRPTPSLPHTLPKLRPTLPSPSGSSPPSGPALPPPLSPPSSPSSNSSSPPSSPRGSKRRRSDQERREKHNDTERKGRQKINSEIKVLKSLLPELQNSAAPKVSVLQCAVDTLKRRTEYATSVQQQNAHLRDENKSLKAEIARLQHLLSMASSPPNQVPLHLHSVSSGSAPMHHSSPANLHQPLESLDHNKRHEGFSFPGPLAPAPSPSLISPAKQWY
eukprot:Phypoly_transcript_06478.p1 GENE.Phypoly_transcript_06478~~Phypoly_transcript_06478.p1  ORF type:complete len:492 (+),score=100.01 Phypoly_transcript_06478:230-1705(+)